MPEEVNRMAVDALSDLLFAPSDTAVANLRREGKTEGVHQVGDVMYDANLTLAPIARERSQALAEAGVKPGGYVLATLHREANARPGPLRSILAGLGRLDEPVIFPAHPRTRAVIDSDGVVPAANIRLLPPVGYLDFAALASQARAIATDSGGVQKEAYWYGVPCVTLREETEWVETVESGWNRLVGTDTEGLLRALADPSPPTARPELYGDGRAAERIARLLSTIRRR
jgi:UDP-N-acetylglucosamine 2-epimerase